LGLYNPKIKPRCFYMPGFFCKSIEDLDENEVHSLFLKEKKSTFFYMATIQTHLFQRC